MSAVRVVHGDALDVLPTMPPDSVDAIVTDPPYGLEFMGNGWDRYTPEAFEEFNRQWAAEALRVLKPGGHLLAFGGTRTYHRLTAGIEDAGFDIRDSITWLYGSGFPKSLDVSKAIDRAAGVAREAIGVNPRAAQQTPKSDATTLGRFAGTPAVLTAAATDDARRWEGWGTALKPASEPIAVARKPLAAPVAGNVLRHGTGALNIDGCRVPGTAKPFGNGTSPGRWPANVTLTHTPDCGDTCQPSCPIAELDQQSVGHDDAGGASRFFPAFRYQAKAPARERPRIAGVAHPTVKPLGLMRWLCRLATPPGGLVVDPFAGSGTTAEAALMEGFRVVAIEREEAYLPLIQARIARAGMLGEAAP